MSVTLNEIAKAAGVSRGTVDRALNNRGRIQPQVAERIRHIAKELGYTPNSSARALALTAHRRKIGAILQFIETPFMQEVLRGIMTATEEFMHYGIELEIVRIEGMDSVKAAESIRRLRDAKVTAIILVGNNDSVLRREIDTCKKAGIDIITVNSDVPSSHRKFFIGQNAYGSGQTAASVMADLLGGKGSIIIYYGFDSTIHSERIRGFRDIISRRYKDIHIIEEKKTGNSRETLAKMADCSLDLHPDVDGIYLCGEGSVELCNILKERSLSTNIHLVLHNLATCRNEDILDRTIDYVIDDDGFGQGFMSLYLLFLWHYSKREPDQEYYYTDIRIINAYNYQFSLSSDFSRHFQKVKAISSIHT
jgi:LacI family transcriptional regulator